MCGIFCSLSRKSHILPDRVVEERLRNRGPDSIKTIRTRSAIMSLDEQDTTGAYVSLVSTVLSLRGSRTVDQPYQDSHGDFTLCWNGEAWSIAGEPTWDNDTECVHSLLVKTVSSLSYDVRLERPSECASMIAEALSQVAGPYAFVLFDKPCAKIYFGRDFLGRRSLLQSATKSGDLTISSVPDRDSSATWTEIEADGVYCVDLRTSPNDADGIESGDRIQYWGRFPVSCAPYQSTSITSSRNVIPRLTLTRDLPLSYRPLEETSSAVAVLETMLREALSVRLLTIPNPPIAEKPGAEVMRKTKVAVLFSGGLDCTVLARLSNDISPPSEPIDLLNVAFENPRMHKQVNGQGGEAQTAYELCPDRITGRASYAELQRICPDREWRFVATNVPYAETIEHRPNVISLMHPHNTEMDLSIANALYFAARGEGYLSNSLDSDQQPYTTTARVLLSGLGADELFAGYTRHTTAYKRNGFTGLLDELQLDVGRLGKRNLGRDDRVISHWSKEARYPYLDEKLLTWALSTPVTEKCGFGEPDADESSGQGSTDLEPGKKVLRCVAWKLGMKQAAKEKKRAIQFGARTAKMETGRTKGTQLLS